MTPRLVPTLALLLSLGCGPTAPPRPAAAPPGSAETTAAPVAEVPRVEGELLPGEPGPVPVEGDDPASGSAVAPVTIVVFADLECPFCGRAALTLAELRRRYPSDVLRIVWKHRPLAFHQRALPAAIAAQAVFRLGGAQAFWTFHDLAFTAHDLSAAGLERIATRAGVDGALLSAELARGEAASAVERDLELARQLDVTGTPTFFVNGARIVGAQPVERFTDEIDAQLARARELTAQGVAPHDLYGRLSTLAYEKPEARAEPPPEDKRPRRVPIEGAPVRGKPTALVTLVVFSEFQCPFCARLEPTLRALEAKYGDRLRIVWRHRPLAFHERAEPAAQLALEARAQKGDAGFWRAHDLLFAKERRLSDEDLEEVARAAGLRVGAAMRAVRARRHLARIEADQELAVDVGALGTPTSFINGRKVVGAQPLERFEEVIDEELARAEALVRAGVAPANVYATLQKEAAPAPEPARKEVPPPTREHPARGPAHARVTIQIFSDFQCPFCKRAEGTLEELARAFPGKLRFVWRNHPLPMHREAQLAAEAGLEAFRQKGAEGFWKMKARLFSDQGPEGLGREALLRHGAALGLDVARLEHALEAGTHRQAVLADGAVAESAGITGVPAFVINGYFVSGAQPLSTFKRVVSRALAEAR